MDEKHQEWYDEASKIPSSVQVFESRPKIVGRQRNRDSLPSDSVSDYYKRTCSIPVLNFLFSELDRRIDC